ncbi:CRISPR-associated endonuclease Cas2 [Vibrio sp. MarTm2]|uniref:CRISPR-associated endonuclease Cas2 n=1 Tax=Vibrio TaxID=662 RepID=UPI0022CD4E22|nr:CRISPR-associated endonuclease Cas2 [Vibrio sp. MarTm2]MDA0129465.1 CRISPR-associated endonuclease Cas2 [Vibrio sp. MarTm2]
MANSHYLICYDISDRKIRYRIEKALLGYGERVQYSVFECKLSDAELVKLRLEVNRWLDEGDKVNYFRLCVHCLRRRLTQGAMVAWQASAFDLID